MKVVTFQAPNGETINVTKAQQSKLERAGKWPRNSSGEFCTVSHGLHDGSPTYSAAEIAEITGRSNNHPNRKPMRDTSIMQGVVEWTLDGTDYRAMDEGASVGIYTKQDGAFVRTATISKPARMTPRAIWNAWKA